MSLPQSELPSTTSGKQPEIRALIAEPRKPRELNNVTPNIPDSVVAEKLGLNPSAFGIVLTIIGDAKYQGNHFDAAKDRFVTDLITNIAQHYSHTAVISAGTTEGVMGAISKARQVIHTNSAQNNLRDFTFIACVPEAIHNAGSSDELSEDTSHVVYTSSLDSNASMETQWRTANERIGSLAAHLGKGKHNNVSILIGGGLGSAQEIASKIARGEQVFVITWSGRLVSAITTSKVTQRLDENEDRMNIIALGRELGKAWLAGLFDNETEQINPFDALTLFDISSYATPDQAREALIKLMKEKIVE